ncbi:hypothetical protein Purlil1_10305 [Purpureocillium lilacinum]|uniref:Uncharacterized protein n=1 Tax=Purpureocillium lilacinum TaxID=33203 RepID=A0ABR0BPC2_PURLI|nr:hypothetical protein Purlil1_10305 [Purpureocillium lilacinum]
MATIYAAGAEALKPPRKTNQRDGLQYLNFVLLSRVHRASAHQPCRWRPGVGTETPLSTTTSRPGAGGGQTHLSCATQFTAASPVCCRYLVRGGGAIQVRVDDTDLGAGGRRAGREAKRSEARKGEQWRGEERRGEGRENMIRARGSLRCLTPKTPADRGSPFTSTLLSPLCRKSKKKQRVLETPHVQQTWPARRSLKVEAPSPNFRTRFAKTAHEERRRRPPGSDLARLPPYSLFLRHRPNLGEGGSNPLDRSVWPDRAKGQPPRPRLQAPPTRAGRRGSGAAAVGAAGSAGATRRDHAIPPHPGGKAGWLAGWLVWRDWGWLAFLALGSRLFGFGAPPPCRSLRLPPLFVSVFVCWAWLGCGRRPEKKPGKGQRQRPLASSVVQWQCQASIARIQRDGPNAWEERMMSTE